MKQVSLIWLGDSDPDLRKYTIVIEKDRPTCSVHSTYFLREKRKLNMVAKTAQNTEIMAGLK
jgi:hypothetical protein